MIQRNNEFTGGEKMFWKKLKNPLFISFLLILIVLKTEGASQYVR